MSYPILTFLVWNPYVIRMLLPIAPDRAWRAEATAPGIKSFRDVRCSRCRQRIFGWSFLSALAWIFLALPAAAQTQFENARAEIRKRLVERQVPSIAAAVAHDGKILWEAGFGWADRENRIPATQHTPYSLASTSKPITTTALMILVERGRIDLDRPVNDYLGDAKLRAGVGDATGATLRRLANHTSGLPLHYQFFYEDEPWRVPSMDETILRYGILMTAPGERYQYSNLGYGVLDYVIARVSGRSYEDFMREQVFIPLGMTRTSVGIGPRMETHAAVRYNAGGSPLPFYDFDHRGASGIFASAHDLVRFGMFHLKARLPDQRPILTDSAIDQMQIPALADYALGWLVAPEERMGYRVVFHGGSMPGVSTLLWLVPDAGITIALVANRAGASLSPVAVAVVKDLLPALRAPKPAAPVSSPEFRPGPELTGQWVGQVRTYRRKLPISLTIESGGIVRGRLGRQLETLLNQPSFTSGVLTGRMMGDLGTEDAARRPYTLTLDLTLRGEVLNGAVIAMSLPVPRGGNAQSHWAELRRSPTNHLQNSHAAQASTVAGEAAVGDDFYVPTTISQEAQSALTKFDRSARNAPLPEPDDVTAWKKVQAAVEARFEAASARVVEQYQPQIVERKLGGVPVFDIKPKGWKKSGKVLVYTHGGGYTLYSARSRLLSAVPMANDTGLRVISVDYTLAPHARWKEVTRQVLTVVSALLKEGHALGSMALYGESAGGGLAAAAVLRMRDEGLGMPAAVVLWSPWSDITETGDSYTTLQHADPLLYYPDNLKNSADAYADPNDQKHPYVSPVYADYSKGFPPTLIQAGTKEILLSSAVRHYQALDQAGIPVKLDLYEGMWHIFQVFHHDIPESKTARAKVRMFLDQHLVQ